MSWARTVYVRVFAVGNPFVTILYRYLSHLLTSVEKLTEIVPGQTPPSGLNARTIYSDFGPVEGYLENGAKYDFAYN